jgi:hypothetical protein
MGLSHTPSSTIQMLIGFFGGRIISRNMRPPRFPVILPSDFSLGGFLKEKVYTNNTHTLENWNTLPRCAFRTSLQELFSGFHQTQGRQQVMRRWRPETFTALGMILIFVLWFQCNLFFYEEKMCQELVTWLFERGIYHVGPDYGDSRSPKRWCLTLMRLFALRASGLTWYIIYFIHCRTWSKQSLFWIYCH